MVNNQLLSYIWIPVLNGVLGNRTGTGYALGLQTFVRNLINVALGLAGLYFFFNLLRGGYEYITAGGDKEGVQKAQGRIRNALFGVVIIFSVFVIIYIVETLFGLNIRQLNIPNI
jgi:hypothetical protein